jgi:chemotaxis signal transduction protein
MSSAQQLVCVDVAGRTLSLWSDSVIEVLRLVALQPLGDLNPALLGAVNRRGQIVTVYNLRQALGLPQAAPRVTDLLVILQTGSGQCAVVVDAVTEILDVAAGQVSAAADLPGISRHVAQVVNLADRMIPVLDVGWLIHQGADRAHAG